MSGQISPGSGRSYSNPCKLRGFRNEQLVLDNRTAGLEAELVARVLPFSMGCPHQSVGIVIERVRRVGREAVKLPRGTMESVGARFRGYIHHAAGSAAIFGPKVVGNDAVFLHTIDGNVFANANG